VNAGATRSVDRHPEDESDLNIGSIQYAVQVLGEVVNAAFSDALRLDHLARLIARAFDGIGFSDRIELGDKHGKLVEALILLENAIDRIDER
jgi:hypothetical protein